MNIYIKNEKGALLISFIIIMALIGILSSSVAYLAQNETYALKLSNSIEQSYYLAESGLRFVMLKIKHEEMDLHRLIKEFEKNEAKVYIPQKAYRKQVSEDLAGHFTLKFDDNSEEVIRNKIKIHSTGIADTKNFVESKRQINARYLPGDEVEIDMKLEDFNNTGEQDDNKKWNLTKEFYPLKKSIEGSDIEAIKFESDQRKNWVLASLNWARHKTLPDLRIWQDMVLKTLNYRLQIKINFYPKNNNENDQYQKDFMAGLSFRIGKNRKNYYGVSFFKSSGRLNNNYPCWLEKEPEDCDGQLGESFRFEGEDELCDTDNSIRCLKANIPYIVFWIKRNNEPIKLIAFSDLTKLARKTEIIKKGKSGEWEFLPWLTIQLDLKEEEVAGQKINNIEVFVKGPGLVSLDSRDIDFSWDWAGDSIQIRFTKAEGVQYSNPYKIQDRSLPSPNLYYMYEIAPDEMGLHALYDNRIYGKNKYNIYFFPKFLLKCEGSACPRNDGQEFVQF